MKLFDHYAQHRPKRRLLWQQDDAWTTKVPLATTSYWPSITLAGGSLLSVITVDTSFLSQGYLGNRQPFAILEPLNELVLQAHVGVGVCCHSCQVVH